jgi:hypothetical protein
MVFCKKKVKEFNLVRIKSSLISCRTSLLLFFFSTFCIFVQHVFLLEHNISYQTIIFVWYMISRKSFIPTKVLIGNYLFRKRGRWCRGRPSGAAPARTRSTASVLRPKAAGTMLMGLVDCMGPARQFSIILRINMDAPPLRSMVVSIPIHIVVSYEFMILPQPTDTYRDGILIW